MKASAGSTGKRAELRYSPWLLSIFVSSFLEVIFV
jgi:hypothetical protein